MAKMVTISEKSSIRDEVSAHEEGIPCLRTQYGKEHDHDQKIKYNTGTTVTFLKIVSKCTRLHLSAYPFQKLSGRGGGGACLWPLGTSPRNDKS